MESVLIDHRITSFSEVMRAFVPADNDEAEFKDETTPRKSKLGSERVTGLFDRKFFRVVLDEAHAIKNYKSRSTLFLSLHL